MEINEVNSNFPISLNKYTYGEAITSAGYSLLNFSREDTAIISAQAKLLSEVEKFNSGEGNAVDMALTGVVSKHQIAANVNVVNAKKEMLDEIISMVDD